MLELLVAQVPPAPNPPGLEAIVLPLTRLAEVTLFDALLGYPPIKALVPIPIFIALAPLIIWFFKKTWQKLDAEARADWSEPPPPPPTSHHHPSRAWRLARSSLRHRTASSHPRLVRLAGRRRAPLCTTSPSPASSERAYDFRPAAAFAILAVVLTLQEYYGGRRFYAEVLRPVLVHYESQGAVWLRTQQYDELWSYGWWVFARVVGYVVIPFPLWKLLFPKDNLLDMGLRVRGFFEHAWIYLLCLAFVLPAMLLVASQPDFGTYYPFYKLSSRSVADFVAWELMYFLQFLTLEMFFRGFLLGALRRSIGAAAIFAMAVPYCMIHFGKPYLEANGAIVAGIVLGSLAMHTRSIYAGFLVHITVAFLMDFLALWKRGALPTELWPS